MGATGADCPRGSTAGVCGRERSYETFGAGGPLLVKPSSMSSYLRFWGFSTFSVRDSSLGFV